MRWVITLAIVASVGCADKVVYSDDPPSTGDGDGDADGGRSPASLTWVRSPGRSWRTTS